MRVTVVLASVVMAAGTLGFVGEASAQDTEVFVDTELELRVARENLEVAAREVARLSAQASAPIVGHVIREFDFTSRRAMLGINIEDSDEGVVVAGVSPGGPADESGIETGDIIVAIEAAELTDSESSSPTEVLIGYMARVMPGESVTLSIVRGDEEHEIEVEARALEAQYFAGAFATPTMPLPQGGFRIGDQPSMAFNFTRRIGRWADMELVELN